ncbi:hypothetical protein SAMN02910456_00630 [Ruminococcaceae bacterium YRB3002]|nr:hypothetical protein SAMN02910456_00630 [Ruminococcaceae bacterium YRB3002]
MAKVIVKIKYMKPNGKRTPGRYANYIATREGVDKIDDSAKFSEPRQQGQTYADYIATRPRAERIGKHGLFTDAGVEVDLKKVSDDLNSFEGTIWTAIVSIRREDAEMLGFETGERWRNIVRAHRDEIAKNFRIRPETLAWYGAFHNESYHPHIHLIIYDRENKGFINEEGIENIKSMFAHAIFSEEMFNLQNDKTAQRDKLRQVGKDEIEDIISRISNSHEDNLMLKALMIDLSERLKTHKGKKVYGYLKKDDKVLVKQIVDEIEKIPAVKELYDLWYEKQEGIYQIYKSDMPTRISLSENTDFKSIRNAVVQAADELGNIQGLDINNMFPDEDEDIIGIDLSEDISRKDLHSDKETAYRKELIRVPSKSDPIYVTKLVTGLLNSVSKVFRDKFKDNPDHMSKMDIKLRRKILDKDEAHGLKHG